MNLKKQDLIQTIFNGRDFKLVGKWRGNLVFSPVDSDEDECLVYTPNEVAELLETGEFRRVGRAFFGRKLANLDELREYTKASIYSASAGQPYTVVKEIYLDSQDFEALSRDFFDDQPWLSKEDGGVTRDGKIRCIRVVNSETEERFLVNNEGFSYCRYTALEIGPTV